MNAAINKSNEVILMFKTSAKASRRARVVNVGFELHQ